MIEKITWDNSAVWTKIAEERKKAQKELLEELINNPDGNVEEIIDFIDIETLKSKLKELSIN